MKIPSKLPGEPVLVWWEDAWSIAGIDLPKEEMIEFAAEGALRCDCGWLIEKNDDFIILVLTLDPHRNGPITAAGPSRIPRSLVKKIVKLAPFTPPARKKKKKLPLQPLVPAESIPHSPLARAPEFLA